MRKFALILGLMASILWLSGCATEAPRAKPVVHDDNSSVQTAPAKAPKHHIDYKGESLDK
jgi:hypothetical protein